jgi:hypothetical protein
MQETRQRLLVQSRIRRAQSALDRASQLLDTGSHIETVETALVAAMSETMEAEKLIQPMWQSPEPVGRKLSLR